MSRPPGKGSPLRRSGRSTGEKMVSRPTSSQFRRYVPFLLSLALSLAGWSVVRADSVEDATALVRSLVSVVGVPGHEGPVRAAIRRAAPTWVSFLEDNLGNLTVRVGSGKPERLLLAHMDEPGYVV